MIISRSPSCRIHQLNITDAGGTDTYDFDLDATDVAQSIARVDIVDNGGSTDLIELDVDSTGFDIYLHPQAVLLNKLDLTFNTGVEQLHLTDHAAQTTGSRPTSRQTGLSCCSSSPASRSLRRPAAISNWMPGATSP